MRLPQMRDRLVCMDGTDLSVQASRCHYCTPREDDVTYQAVEVGFPSVHPPETWKDYADGPYPADVYGYVPTQLVKDFIAEHGGLANGSVWPEDMA